MENPRPISTSPNTHSANSTSSSSSNNGVHNPLTRSEPNNPYPTTFVQADTTSFKQVVQMLTGTPSTAKHAAGSKPDPHRNPIPPIRTGGPLKKEKSGKLYERRNGTKSFKISPLVPGFSPRNAEILSPSLLDFPSLVLSPVTPLIPDPFNRSPAGNLDMEAENKAIAKKGFYLHPSPRGDAAEPRLLPLFPVTSPRVSGSSSS